MCSIETLYCLTLFRTFYMFKHFTVVVSTRASSTVSLRTLVVI